AEVGFEWSDDINAPRATGISRYPINSSDGKRVSTNDAYLEPRRENDCLDIVGDTMVTEVIFRGNRAVGVKALHGEKVVEFKGGEVVLAAGVIHSPSILMRSGVGPQNQLSTLGIDCVSNLPRSEEHT